MKKINVEKDEGPGIEIGGEVNEGLEAQLLEEIGVVNGERVGWVDSAPLGGLRLQTLHLFFFLFCFCICSQQRREEKRKEKEKKKVVRVRSEGEKAVFLFIYLF